MILTRSSALASLLAAVCGGCFGLTSHPTQTVSVGDSANGFLRRGVSLPDQGAGFRRSRPGESTRFGTAEMVASIQRAAASVAERFPGTPPVRIGDLSAPDGGRHPRHRSHRSGRDVDLIFYATDALGRPVQGRGWLVFDRFGVARESRVPGEREASQDLFFFDEARNWQLVRSLLMDSEARVQWLFCSRGVKARLLEYAAIHEPDPEAIFRATWALHQPSRGNPHADHFHVRLFCTPEQMQLGCQDRGPRWPWLRKEVEKPEIGHEAYDDAALVHALLSEDATLPEG